MFLPTVEEHAHQHSSFVGFLTGVRGHLFVLICISLIFSDTEDLFMCLLAIWMASIKILNHHVVHLKYYIINQLYFNKRAICKKKNLLHANKQFLWVFKTFGKSHFSSAMALPACRPWAVGTVWVIRLWPLYYQHVCDSAAQCLWWACRGAGGHGSRGIRRRGPTGLPCACLSAPICSQFTSESDSCYFTFVSHIPCKFFLCAVSLGTILWRRFWET